MEEAQSVPRPATGQLILFDLRNVNQISRHLLTPDLDIRIVDPRAHNEALPISQTPNEVLERHFHFCLDRQERHHQRLVFAAGCVYLRLTPYPEWLQITRICSRWCRVALGYSRLWSTIASDSKQRFDLCIEKLPPKQVIDVALKITDNQVA
ncbi:hypothetical protein HETIRDRAFT_414203 [Heterobasidion irregulare TC 32-1]|uniref:F-box domain-containing protein n=1 Tax=Heterobasidion irregulare (strain TC 32-1) TaxID=747525 RepID=W4KGU3_HETIT|nr:uncharacterized protein HETIRDRAFT_414203 [Heterobasidion irregulare TC 32-1]ETW85078.1 hypothetical protein HETIRDRAFT_414203 [Heterobasidion irregulare TC 32-1]